MQRLVLFDIDETMIASGGSGRKALERAMRLVFEREISFNGHSLSGKTDPQICLEVLTAHGYDPDHVSEALPQLFEVYLPILAEEVDQAQEAIIHEGVVELLDLLQAHPEAHLALLTGNIEPGARVKLSRFGLNKYFHFGAFGCDSANRMELPAVAHRRAHEKLDRRFDISDIVIIGDARNDVLCARGYGAKSIAVCTGKTLKSELVQLEPNYLFDTLGDTKQVVDAIFAS